MNLTQWSVEVHELAKEKGWWDKNRDFGELISLIHCELSEAYEAYRHNEPVSHTVDSKPEGIAVELVDALIRILDTLASMDVDVEYLTQVKHNYNKTREYRHGGLVA